MEEEYKKKEFKFKGKSVEELKTLDVREFAKLVGARQRRTILRNFQAHEEFISKCNKRTSKNKPIRTHSRDLVVVPQLVGMKIAIYRGNQFVPVEITGEMLGHVFGELAPTRARIKHTKSGVGATKGTKSKKK